VTEKEIDILKDENAKERILGNSHNKKCGDCYNTFKEKQRTDLK
jgi:hypothetical protein